MATPAAILSILVEAETTKATAALRTFDRTVARTGTTSKAATTRTTAFNRATGSLGSSLGRAARYASGAAVAYLSIAQAKSAITTTQDLAKTTSALNRNLGLTTKTASRWGTVAKARDIDTKSLNMSFTTLSRRLTDVQKGSETAIDSFRDIGVTQKDLERTGGDFNKQLLLVADAFGEAEGGALRQQAAQKLLGRGYQTILPMMAEGAKGLQEQHKWADKYGTVLDKKAVKSQMDLVNAQRESKVAMLGLQVSFAQFLTPALEKANKQFQRISHIIGSNKLTQTEKFERVGRIMEKWGDKALDAFVLVLPKMVEAAGEAAPRIAKAFVDGFLNADITGKLAIGALMFGRYGGVAAAGRTLGGRFGKVFGVAAAAAFVIEFAPKIQDAVSGFMADKFGGEKEDHTNLFESLTGTDLTEFGGAGKAVDSFKAMQEQTAKLEDQLKSHQKAVSAIQKAGQDNRQQSLHRHLNEVSAKYDLSSRRTEAEFEQTRQRLGSTTAKQAKDVAGNTDSMVSAVGQGLKRLGDNTNKALQAFGAKKVAFSVDLNKSSSGGAFHGFQRGGPINQGAPSGDSVPALLERGEYVLNRMAVAKAGKQNLDALNFGAAPRFQSGGVVEALGPYAIPPFSYDASHAGGNSHWHIAMSTPSAVVAVGKKLQGMGFMVGEHPAFGGVNAQHAPGGYHYSNQAIDVNSAADETRSETARVAALLNGGAFKAISSQLKRIILGGPDGSLKSMGQGALDRARKAAQSFINSKRPAEGAEGLMSGSGEVESTFAKVAKKLSNSKTATLALGMAGYAESGMRDLSYGHSSSQGALQLLSSTAAGLGISPHDEQAIASAFLLRGFFGKGGANTLAAQGLPAHMVAQLVQGSAFSSGSNYLAQAGPARAWMARYGLQKGGMPSLDTGGRVTQAGLAQVHPGDVHMGSGPQVKIVFADGMGWLKEFVNVEIDGATPDIVEIASRSLGRGAGRSRQLAR